MHVALEITNCRMPVGGRCIKELRYADNTTLVKRLVKEVAELLIRVVEKSPKMGL